MNCVMCQRPMEKAAAWVGAYPIGPKCLEKMNGKRLAIHSKVVKVDQPDLFGELKMSYAEIEMKVVQWGEARGIVQNSNNMAQAIKTLEEVGELLEAIHLNDKDSYKLELGDILITLILGAACADVDVVECLRLSFEKIKDRKGTLRSDGVFVKE